MKKKTTGTRFTANLFFDRLEAVGYPLRDGGTIRDHWRVMSFLDNDVSYSEVIKINKALEGEKRNLAGLLVFPEAHQGPQPRWAKGIKQRETIVPEVIERNRAEMVAAFHRLFPKATREEIDTFVAHNQKNPEANAICRMVSDKLETLLGIEESQKELLASKAAEVAAVKETVQLLRLTAAPTAQPYGVR